MAQSKVTLNEIMTAVRELTFDRFIIPAFAVKQMGKGTFLKVDKTYQPEVSDETEEVILGKLSIYTVTPATEETEESIEKEIVALPFQDYPNLERLMEGLIDRGIIIAYTPYFRGEEPSTSLIQVTKELTEDLTLFRKYFFSDEDIKDMIRWYYRCVLDIPDVDLNDETVGKLKRPSEKHLIIWVSYYLVDKRRLYENADGAIGQSFTDGSDYNGSTDMSNSTGTTTTVQIGSVFSVTEDPSKGYFYEDYNRVGSDNVWGDRYSFWYRLMLYLRDLLENTFGDYSLRKDNVIPGYISLQRELDFREYFDSYPFVLSPLSRGIISKTP